MIQLSDIQAALERIRADIRISPCTHSETFSGLTNNSIFLKLDNQQRTGAFKERGALNKLLTLTQEERSRGVIAASAGNHAQGVAYHAGRHKIARTHRHAAAHAAHEGFGNARLRRRSRPARHELRRGLRKSSRAEQARPPDSHSRLRRRRGHRRAGNSRPRNPRSSIPASKSSSLPSAAEVSSAASPAPSKKPILP